MTSNDLIFLLSDLFYSIPYFSNQRLYEPWRDKTEIYFFRLANSLRGEVVNNLVVD